MTTYFWLTQDKRNGNVQVYLPEKLVSSRNKITGEIGYLPKLSLTTFAYNFDCKIEYDLLDMDLFMISGKIKKVFDKVAPYLDYREFCITLDKTESSAYYYVPMIPKLDIDFERMRFDDRYNQYSCKMFIDSPLQSDMFKLSDSNSTYMIVSLLVAEKLLQDGAKNIRLIPIEVAMN